MAKQTNPDFLNGVPELVVLQLLSRRPMYGYEIAQELSQRSKGLFELGQGTLYPLLSKMRRENLVDYEWKESEAGPPRKYYQLTVKGKAQLSELNDYWKQINATVVQLGKPV